jgi:hypothetical protein
MERAEMEEAASHASDVAGELQVVKLQNSVMQLDLDWLRYREARLYRGDEPSVLMARGYGIALMLLGGFFCVGGEPLFILYGLIAVTGGIFFLVHWTTNAKELKAYRINYEVERAKLVSEISRQTHSPYPKTETGAEGS